MAYNKLPLSERIARNVKRVGECLEWQGARMPHGYGRVRVNGVWKRAHRVVYELVHGPLLADQVVRHRCDNTRCVELSHLVVGTQADNVRDMHERKRARAVSVPYVGAKKLSREQVAEIKRRHIKGKRGSNASALAREFGVSDFTVSKIVRHAMQETK